jgi:murein DD-endopeptidase MepM/ murein hydrolase activator NlpD
VNKKQIIQRQLKNLQQIFQRLHELFLQLPKLHRIVMMLVASLLLLLLLLPSTKQLHSAHDLDVANLEIGKRYQIALPQESSEKKKIKTVVIPSLKVKPQTAIDDAPNTVNSQQQVDVTWQTVKVRSGDSLARIFKRLGFSAQDTYAVSTAKGKDAKLLTKINVGDTLRIANNDAGQITALEYPLSKIETLYINLIGNNYQSHKENKTVEIREAFAYGTIRSNFWNAGTTAGLTDGQIINFANIFGWDIDFALDIRKGDNFQVIFEKKFVEGEYVGTGNILAAEFVNQGEIFHTIRFSDNEYYSLDGKSMRKAFLRAPVNFKYISSNFKPKRFHPIQKRWKAHRGTDYRANTGTPVVAAGNGKVTHSTYNKYNGHYVFIQHGNGIVTKYLHFSKRAVKKGQRVKQGQVIGYVGSTGMSQAPHLHYEFLLNGVHRNPRTVKLPDAKPIAKKYKGEFNLLANKRLQELDSAKNALSSISEGSVIHQSDE